MNEQLAQMDQAAFRHVVGHFASGVTVITTNHDGVLYGTTASAVSSLSMDPPMMLACLNRSSSTHDHVVAAGRYAINILAVDQGDLAAHFGRKGADKFSGVSHTLSEQGLPLIDGALATIECVVAETAIGGTHTVFLGEVTAAQARPGDPLAYFRGRFDALERTSLETEAYDRVRLRVLGRGTPLGEPIAVRELAAIVQSDEPSVYNALVRLEAEGLVSREPGGAFVPTPITASLVENLYSARETIESGVIQQYLASASDATIAEITRLAEDLAAREPRNSEELDAFLEANLNLHCAIVALAGSRRLVSQFRQLSISAAWRDTYRSEVWQEKLGHPFIPELTAAIAARDAEEAARVVRAQIAFVVSAAAHMIDQKGGAL
ncbi:flavin reductase [Leucobacter massiliensis]|uniref:FCD domain-containing protein n=1 Tax=Leucobacter massiliensis TaxID=1686285 RepID=A0A2S9QME8_9MICO|nr:flavin reductase [Leucobacter massiliensis]PRI10772.1 hypothetical protein B4915_07685 [Leucobacter massiliensis]